MAFLNLVKLPEESRVNLDVEVDSIPQSQRDREYDLQERAGVEPTANFSGLRAELAQKQVAEELNTLYNASEKAILAGANSLDVSDKVQKYILKNSEEDTDISLEKEAAINSTAQAFNEDQQTAINAANSALTEEQIDSLAKSEIIESWRQRNIEKAESKKDWKKFTKFIFNPLKTIPSAEDQDAILYGAERVTKSLLPILGEHVLDQEVFPMGKQVPLELSKDTIRSRQKKYIRDYANTHTPKELSQFLDAVDDYMWNKSMAGPATIYDFMEDFNVNTNWANDFFGGFEVATPAIAAVGNAIKASKAAGRVSRAKTGIIEAVKDGDKATTVDEYVLPNALKPFQGSQGTSYSKKVEAEVADVLADREAMEIIEKTRTSGVMDDAEIFVNKELFKEEFKAAYGKEMDDLADINAIDFGEGPSGEVLVAVDIGTGIDGTKAMDEAAAIFKAKKLGLPDGSYVISNSGGEGYFIRYMQPLKDQDFTPIAGAVEDFKAKGFTRVFAGGGVATSERFHQKVTEASRKEATLRAKLWEKYSKDIKHLNSSERDLLDSLYLKGQQANEGKGAWHTKDQLEDWNVPDRVQKAYFNVKHLSDAQYIIENDKLVRTLTRDGNKLYNGEIVGKQIDLADITEDVYDTMKIKNLDTSKMSFDDFKETVKDKVIIKGRSIDTAGEDFNYAVFSPNEYSESVLPRFLLPYQEGGMREYSFGNLFVQNGRTFHGNKNIYNGSAKTLRAGTNRKALQQYADEGNRAIRIYNAAMEDGDLALAARRIAESQFKHFHIETWEDLNDLVKTGFLDPSHDLQIIEDGGKYVYNNGRKSIDQAGVSSTDALYELARARDRYYNERGALLDSLNGEHTPIKSVFEIYDKTLAKAARTNTISEAEQWMAKEFDRNFRQFVDTRYWDNTGKTSLDMLRDAPLMKIDEAPEGMRDGIRAAMRFRDRYNIFAMAETPLDKYIKHALTWTARGLSNIGEDIGIPRDAKAWRWMADRRPDKFLTGVGFHFAMGIYNTAQFMKQALGVLTKPMIHPVHGTHALLAAPFIRMAYAFKDSNAFLKESSNVLNRLVGISRKDLDRFFEYCDWYSTFRAQDLRPGMTREHADFLRSNKLAKNSTMFANAGNQLDYFVSDLTSFLSRPKASFQEIAMHSDDLYINMSRFDISKAQSFAGILQQWLTYPARMTEAVFNKRLTKAQRSRLIVGQLALWGVGGTLGAEAGINAYKWMRENSDIPEEVANDVVNGLLTNLAREHGYDLQEGLGLLDIADTYFNVFKAEKGLLELNMPALKTFGQLTSVFNAVKDVIAPKTGVFNGNTWLIDRASDRTAPASVRNFSNAALGVKEGVMYNSNRELIKENVTPKDVVMRLIGFKEINEEKEHINKYVLRDYKEDIRDAAEQLKPFMDQLIDYKALGKYEDSAAMHEDWDKVWANYVIERERLAGALKYNHPEYANASEYDLFTAVEKYFREPVTAARVSGEKTQEVTGFEKIIMDYLKMKGQQ